jgi:uncharacterized protein YPO0396
MTVMQELPARPEKAVDARTACTFLQAQGQWLAHGLEHASAPDVVGTVLGMHDASHEAWLDLIAAIERADEAAAQEVAALYGYHGRVVGSLERGLDPLLTGAVQHQVRRLLVRRLETLTAQAVELVEGLGSTPARA